MTLDLAPGATVRIDGYPYTVEEYTAVHGEDFRIDVVRLSGPTQAHERWLVAALPEPYLMLMQRLEQEWLSAPMAGIAHDGELFANVYRGNGYRVRRSNSGKSKEGRIEYALFRANSGRVILTIGQNDDYDAWIGVTLAPDAIQLPSA